MAGRPVHGGASGENADAGGIRDAAALLLTTGLGYPEDWRPTDWMQATDIILGDLAGTMADADLYIVSPAMRDVVVTAALTLTLDDLALFGQDDLPALKGLLVLLDPLIVTTLNGQFGDDVAYMWDGTASLSTVDENKQGRSLRLGWTRVPAVQVTSFSDSYGPIQPDSFRDFASYAASEGTPIPPLMIDGIRCVRCNWPATDEQRAAVENHRRAALEVHAVARTQAEAIGWDEDHVEADTPGSEIVDVDGLFSVKFLYAFWRLCAQEISEITDADVKNATRAAAERAGTSPEVRVTQLRATGRSNGESDSGAALESQMGRSDAQGSAVVSVRAASQGDLPRSLRQGPRRQAPAGWRGCPASRLEQEVSQLSTLCRSEAGLPGNGRSRLRCMADPNEASCQACCQDLVPEDVDSRSVVRGSTETGSNALVQSFCSEVCMAEWLVARLTPLQRAHVLDPYLSRDPVPVPQPFWYGRG